MKKVAYTSAMLLAAAIAPTSFANALSAEEAQEVRQIVREVLADADSRAALAGGSTAGVTENGGIYLEAPDGSYRLNVGGQVQFRYYLGNDDLADNPDNYDGFEMRRTKVSFNGHVGNPRFGYGIVLASDRRSGDVEFEDAFVNFEVTEGYTVQVGQFKLPFAAQELVSSKRQVAVERGIATEYHTLNRADAVQLHYINEDKQYQFFVALSDGGNSGYTELDDGNAFGVTGRVDYVFTGDLDDFNDYLGSTEEALRVGGAVHTDFLESSGHDHVFAATIDAGYKVGGWGFLGAVYFAGAETLADLSGADETFGFLAQADYLIPETQWDAFARFEIIDDSDTEETEPFYAITIGANHHLSKHIKFTTDLTWVYGPEGVTNGFDAGAVNRNPFSGTGLYPGDLMGEDGKIVWRNQLQLSF